AGRADGGTAPVASIRVVPARGRRRRAPAPGRRELTRAAAIARGPSGGHSRRGPAPARQDPARRAFGTQPAAIARPLEGALPLSLPLLGPQRTVRGDHDGTGGPGDLVGAVDEGAEPPPGAGAAPAP